MTAAVNGLRHQALLYDSPDAFAGAVLPFVEEGLRRQQPVLAVIHADNLMLLRSELGAAAAAIEFIDAAGWYTFPGRTMGRFYRYCEKRAGTTDRIRIVGEPVWTGRDELETVEWNRFESILNVTLGALPVSMLCPYNSQLLPGPVLAAARRTHPELAGGTGSETYAQPASFYAECDETALGDPPADARCLDFDADLALVRRFVARHAPALGLPAGRLDDIVLAVNEVATNAVRHGGGTGRLALWRAGNRVLAQVSDPGRLAAGVFGYQPSASIASGGHGLWITRQMCDLVEIRTGVDGTTVRLHVTVDPAGQDRSRTSQTHTSSTSTPGPTS